MTPLQRSVMQPRSCLACNRRLREWERRTHMEQNPDCKEAILKKLAERFGYIRG